MKKPKKKKKNSRRHWQTNDWLLVTLWFHLISFSALFTLFSFSDCGFHYSFVCFLFFFFVIECVIPKTIVIGFYSFFFLFHSDDSIFHIIMLIVFCFQSILIFRWNSFIFRKLFYDFICLDFFFDVRCGIDSFNQRFHSMSAFDILSWFDRLLERLYSRQSINSIWSLFFFCLQSLSSKRMKLKIRFEIWIWFAIGRSRVIEWDRLEHHHIVAHHL